MASEIVPQSTSFLPGHPAWSGGIPPLENGDLLSQSEFERRYAAMPEVKKAELIEGVVYMASPVSYDDHSTPHKRMLYFYQTYELATPGVECALEATVRIDPKNTLQPDSFLWMPKSGRARKSKDGYIESAPELVSEISASTVSIDLNQKFEVYRRGGVKEYVVWRVQDREIDWFIRQGEKFEQIQPGADGIVRSEVFPGLWLDRSAMLADNFARVLETLRAGLETPEHQDFVEQLKAKVGG